MICLGRLTPKPKPRQVNSRLTPIMKSLLPVSTARNTKTPPRRSNQPSQESGRERIRLIKLNKRSEKAIAIRQQTRERDATITAVPTVLKRSPAEEQPRNEKRC